MTLISITEQEDIVLTDALSYISTTVAGGTSPIFERFGTPLLDALVRFRGKVVVPVEGGFQSTTMPPLVEDEDVVVAEEIPEWTTPVWQDSINPPIDPEFSYGGGINPN